MQGIPFHRKPPGPWAPALVHLRDLKGLLTTQGTCCHSLTLILRRGCLQFQTEFTQSAHNSGDWTCNFQDRHQTLNQTARTVPPSFTLETEAEKAPTVNMPINTQGSRGEGPITGIRRWRCGLFPSLTVWKSHTSYFKGVRSVISSFMWHNIYSAGKGARYQ